MRKVIFGILISIVVIGLALMVEKSFRSGRPIVATEKSNGNILPNEIYLTDFDSKEKIQFEKYKGKVLLINFWASWCDACMAEMPSIQVLYDKMKQEGFEVIAVNVDENPEKVVSGIVKRLGLSFKIFTDQSGELAKHFDVAAIPFTVVAGRDHKIIWAESGERDWSSESVVAEITKLLK